MVAVYAMPHIIHHMRLTGVKTTGLVHRLNQDVPKEVSPFCKDAISSVLLIDPCILKQPSKREKVDTISVCDV